MNKKKLWSITKTLLKVVVTGVLLYFVARKIDLGELKSFDVAKGASASAREDAVVKSVLVNWGIAALAYLVVGKVLDRVIRPRG